MAPAWWKNLRWTQDSDSKTGTDVKYEALSPGQISPRDSEIDESMRGQQQNLPRRKANIPWIISTIIFGFTTLVLLVKVWKGQASLECNCSCPGSDDRLGKRPEEEFGTFKEGFNTELSKLEVVIDRFDFGLVYVYKTI